MSGQPATNYHIASSHVNVAQLRGNVRIAEKLGLRDEVLKAYRHIVQKLTTDPKGWGVPAGHLETLQVQLYSATTKLFRVDYGVDEVHRLVYVKDVHFFFQEQ